MIVIRKVKPLHSVHPGEWYFGTEYERIHTVLGSCVALTAWHPQLKLGGLCHYLLTRAPEQKRMLEQDVSKQKKFSGSKTIERDCRYAIYALEQMKLAMMSFADPKQFHLGLFGGGDMFASRARTSIGADNIQFAREWLARENLQPKQVDVGGTISRSLILIMQSGEIQLKHYQMNAS